MGGLGFTYDTADREEPYDDCEDRDQPCGILSDDPVDLYEAEEVETDVQIEHGADADGAEETHEERLLLFFDLPDLPVEGEDDGEAAEEEDQDAEEDEAVDWDDVVVDEGRPGADGAEPHEDREIEEHVYCRLERVV